MTLVPTEGVVGIITDLYEQSPEAAAELYRLSLYETLADELDEVRPEMTEDVLKSMAEINAAARRTLLRNHVGKALNGEPEPDDLQYAESLAILDEFVQKGLVGWALQAFNNRVRRDDQGRFASSDYSGAPGEQRFPTGDRPQEQGAIDLMSLTTGASQDQGNRMTRNMFNPDGTLKTRGEQIANDWYGPSQGTNRRSYNRTRVLGEALTGASEPGSAAHTVGSIAQFAGKLGPEAEKVLGPGIRRTAYRYRGTEKKPDKAVTSFVDRANNMVQQLNSEDPQERAFAESWLERAGRTTPREAPDPVAAVIAARNRGNLSPDQRALYIRGDAAVAGLLAVDGRPEESVLPNLELVRLSLASGDMPPSQGVIIDEDGNVTTQAVGYNGDHYLPFDLRNLGDLRGGQYVRSRATGGPTTEDLYTGLLTGARQIQVVSNSGVFTVEFDPELRGGRRYSDKARRMIERYGAMLQAIDDPNSNLFEPGKGLPQAEVQRIRTEAGRHSRTPDEFQHKYRELLKTAQLKASFTDQDMADFDQMAIEHGQEIAHDAAERADRAGHPMSQQRIREMIEDEARQFKRENQPTVRKLKLDGIGYNQALQALKQEFPYYIRRADFMPLPNWLRDRKFDNPAGYSEHAPGDLGYVEPGQTNTSSAQTGGRKVPGRQNRASVRETPRGEGETERAGQNGGAGERRESSGNGGQERRVTLDDLAKPRSPLMREAGLAANVVTNAFGGFAEEVPEDATDEHVRRYYSRLTYLQWKSKSLQVQVGPARAGEAFVQWLNTEATPVQAEMIVDGLGQLVRDRRSGPNVAAYEAQGVPDADALDEQVQKILGTYEVFHPFNETPPNTEPWLVPPDTGLNRPPKMPGVPDITETAEEFEAKGSNIWFNDPPREAVFKSFENLEPKSRADMVSEAFDAYEAAKDRGGDITDIQNELINRQFAWSYFHARDINRRLQPYLGTDAAPLEEAAKAYRPRSRLIFG